jgi:HEAT repeat protein
MKRLNAFIILAVFASASFAADAEFNKKLKDLQDKNENVRVSAVQWFGGVQTAESAKALADIYAGEQNSYVRMKIIDAWTAQQTQGALVAVLSALNDTDPYVRDQAAINLAYFGNRKGVADALAGTMAKENDERVKESTLNTLSNFGDDKSADEVIKAAKDPKNKEMRKFAVKRLQRMKSSKAKSELKRLESDPDKEIRDIINPPKGKKKQGK